MRRRRRGLEKESFRLQPGGEKDLHEAKVNDRLAPSPLFGLPLGESIILFQQYQYYPTILFLSLLFSDSFLFSPEGLPVKRKGFTVIPPLVFNNGHQTIVFVVQLSAVTSKTKSFNWRLVGAVRNGKLPLFLSVFFPTPSSLLSLSTFSLFNVTKNDRLTNGGSRQRTNRVFQNRRQRTVNTFSYFSVDFDRRSEFRKDVSSEF